jgi:hypothetical protein
MSKCRTVSTSRPRRPAPPLATPRPDVDFSAAGKESGNGVVRYPWCAGAVHNTVVCLSALALMLTVHKAGRVLK